MIWSMWNCCVLVGVSWSVMCFWLSKLTISNGPKFLLVNFFWIDLSLWESNGSPLPLNKTHWPILNVDGLLWSEWRILFLYLLTDLFVISFDIFQALERSSLSCSTCSSYFFLIPFILERSKMLYGSRPVKKMSDWLIYYKHKQQSSNIHPN